MAVAIMPRALLIQIKLLARKTAYLAQMRATDPLALGHISWRQL
jgi:hypothetical protein